MFNINPTIMKALKKQTIELQAKLQAMDYQEKLQRELTERIERFIKSHNDLKL